MSRAIGTLRGRQVVQPIRRSRAGLIREAIASPRRRGNISYTATRPRALSHGPAPVLRCAGTGRDRPVRASAAGRRAARARHYRVRRFRRDPPRAGRWLRSCRGSATAAGGRSAPRARAVSRPWWRSTRRWPILTSSIRCTPAPGVAPSAVVVAAAPLVGAARRAPGAAGAQAILAGYQARVEAAPAVRRRPALRSRLVADGAVRRDRVRRRSGDELPGLDQPARTVALALATSQLGGLLSGDELGHAGPSLDAEFPACAALRSRCGPVAAAS